MRRTMRLTRGAALAAMLALPAFRAGAQDGPMPAWPYPSTQQPTAPGPGGASPQAGVGSEVPGSSGAPGTPGTQPGGPVGPDGTPLSTPTDSTNSGAFNNPAGNAAGAGGGFAPGLGGFAGGAGDRGAPPGVIGDFPTVTQAIGNPSPAATRFPNLPQPTPPVPPQGGNPGTANAGGNSILVKLTGLKIADNMSPRPQDRVFYSFNYFDNVNASFNKGVGNGIQNLQIYHNLFGIEKTFLDGRASIGFRVPLNTLSLKSTLAVPGLGGSSTSVGDLSIYTKYALYSDDRGNLISTGLQVTAPTGPAAFGGNRFYKYFRDTQIQPFVGFIFARDRFYVQGFSSILVPTMSQDVTLYFNDLAVGYYVYRPVEPDRFLTAVVPTAEVHVASPLNHRGFSATDLAGTPDIVNMTFGTNIELRRRAIITAAYVTPVTGPKPFNAEFVLLFNLKFGGSAQSRLPGFPTQ